MKKTFEKIIENELLFVELATSQFSGGKKLKREDVREVLSKRNIEIRNIINETNNLIDEVISPLIKNPTEMSAQNVVELEDIAKRLSGYRESIDTGLCYQLRDALTVYAKSIGDDAMYIRNMFYKGLALFYLDTILFKAEMSDCFDEVIQYSDRYEEFDSETRNLIARAYGNSYISVADLNIDEIFKRYDRAIDFWDNTVKRVDPDFPLKAYYQNLHENLCSSTITALRSERKIFVKDEYKKRLLESATFLYEANRLDELVETNDYTSVQVKNIYYYNAARFHNGLISCEKLLEKLYEMHSQADDDYSYDDLYKKLHVGSLFLVYLHLFPPQDLSIDDQKRITKEIEDGVFSYVEKIPDNMSSSRVTTMLSNFAIGSFNAFDDITYLKLLLKLTVFRHAPTFVHSVMVAKISCTITDYLINFAPEMLLSLPNINCIEDVLAKRDEILTFVWYSGLIHDIGKIVYSHMVSFYVRKLNDHEFEMIKQHSIKAEAFIKQAPSFDVNISENHHLYNLIENSILTRSAEGSLFTHLSDIAFGHHKSFDGKFGYPNEFDNLKSHVKSIIDIVTVADSIDAATDSVGRSYAVEKTLNDMREDMLSQIGTRYCPDVTKYVFDDERLFKKIDNILDEYRYDLYHSCLKSDILTSILTPPLEEIF